MGPVGPALPISTHVLLSVWPLSGHFVPFLFLSVLFWSFPPSAARFSQLSGHSSDCLAIPTLSAILQPFWLLFCWCAPKVEPNTKNGVGAAQHRSSVPTSLGIYPMRLGT